MDFKTKYLKYKTKYLQLKKIMETQQGGDFKCIVRKQWSSDSEGGGKTGNLSNEIIAFSAAFTKFLKKSTSLLDEEKKLNKEKKYFNLDELKKGKDILIGTKSYTDANKKIIKKIIGKSKLIKGDPSKKTFKLFGAVIAFENKLPKAFMYIEISARPKQSKGYVMEVRSYQIVTVNNAEGNKPILDKFGITLQDPK